MTMNWKRNSKKYIAGILTIALAVGAGQSYGSMEVSAQERTLPGIEKLVQDTVASSDGTFHILEIVPSKENATIGYLAGGEEPVSEGRKLSEMPSATERQTAMDSLDAAKFPTTGPVTFSAYSESTGASRTEDVRGRFVFRQDGSGRYNYQQIDAVYREIANGETVAAGERYNRYSALEAAGDSNRDAKSVPRYFPIDLPEEATDWRLRLSMVQTAPGDMRRAYMQFRRRIWPLLIKRVFRQKIMWTGQSIRR